MTFSHWDPPVPLWSATDKSSFAYESTSKRWPEILAGTISGLVNAAHALSYQDDGENVTGKMEESKVIIEKLSKLKHDMGRDRPLEAIGLSESDESGTAEFDEVVKQKGWTWFNAPWLFAECYLYRLIRSFFATSQHWKYYDPFAAQKISAFRSSGKAINELAKTVEELVRKAESAQTSNPSKAAAEGGEGQKLIFYLLAQSSLWGNATDLSLLTSLSHADIQDLQAGGLSTSAQAERAKYILTGLGGLDQAWAKVSAAKDGRVDFVLDNAGFEVTTDLLFADWLLATGHVKEVVFHPKVLPWFVSDVTPADFHYTLAALQSSDFFTDVSVGQSDGGKKAAESATAKAELDASYFLNAQGASVQPSQSYVIDTSAVTKRVSAAHTASGSTAIQRLAARWSKHLSEGRFRLAFDGKLGQAAGPLGDFWTSFHSYADLPTAAPDLNADLRKSSLVIFKGDLNTRKLLSDARWPDTAPFDQAMGPLAGRFDTLVLRTCKADVCAGLSQERFEAVQREDPKWRVNGRWAIIVYVARS
ncbi:Uncharacterized conserved protein [Ceraceosorus bombacis]|uniref:Sugar phosphate phosphatase n=1 Tax=Ceraceosorus bombacis TaxID=401625 RepID=A0A0P1BE94_9BASI|nr:Uncharacterized conserved protein [Ceraceosorus bombacis]